MSRSKAHRSRRGNEWKAKRKAQTPLNKKYRDFRKNGDEDPGDRCPRCGSITGFQSGFLVCNNCDWIDSGSDAIELDAA